MAQQNVWEYDSDAFTSLWMLQNICINEKNTDILRIIDVPELKYILQKPCVYIYSRTPVSSEEASLLVSSSHVGRKVPRPEEINPSKAMERPFVVLILLNPSEKQGQCFLSKNDCTLVQQKKKILQHFDNVIYVVKGRCRKVTALQPLSCELQRQIHGDTALNKVFPKIYRFPEDQVDIRTRVGLCIHFSIVDHLQEANDIISNVKHQISQERGLWNGSRAKFTSYVKKKLSGETFNVCTVSLNKSNHKIFEDLSRDIHGEISHKKLLGTILMSNVSADEVCKILEENIDKVLLGKMPVLKECQGKRNSKTTQKHHSNTARYPYASKKTLQPSPESLVASTSAMFSYGHKCTDKCKIVLNKTEKTTVAKEIFTGICKYVTESEDNLSAFCRSLSEELTKRGDSVMLHELKTVSLR
ncbi:unnamed protein product [Mytilus coruscus]|uniref:Uncharacterized protein n=1 Tax=Mytilus coruscus TaxID=42192 RepID=A0A6J7ZZ25_MYTCO|nr:unnamed protein product [Mytilus coruscus]